MTWQAGVYFIPLLPSLQSLAVNCWPPLSVRWNARPLAPPSGLSEWCPEVQELSPWAIFLFFIFSSSFSHSFVPLFFLTSLY